MKAGTELSVLAFFLGKLYQILGNGVNGMFFSERKKRWGFVWGNTDAYLG